MLLFGDMYTLGESYSVLFLNGRPKWPTQQEIEIRGVILCFFHLPQRVLGPLEHSLGCGSAFLHFCIYFAPL
jgi:hypothetical protein